MNSDWILIGGLGLCFFLIFFAFGGLFVGTSVYNDEKNNTIEDARHDLNMQGYNIVAGIVNSPTVLEVTDNYFQFVTATENNTKLYQTTNNQFIAIFNSTYGLAYEPKYADAKFWGIWDWSFD